jgi:hypothetical protein
MLGFKMDTSSHFQWQLPGNGIFRLSCEHGGLSRILPPTPHFLETYQNSRLKGWGSAKYIILKDLVDILRQSLKETFHTSKNEKRQLEAGATEARHKND